MDTSSRAGDAAHPADGRQGSLPAGLRAARAEDLSSLVALENAAFTSDRISRRNFRYFLKSPTARLIVAIVGDRLAGYALVLFRAQTALARLYSIAVDADFQGAGIGRKLLQAAEEAAYDADRLFLRLEVRADNPAALGLYEKSGYRRFARVKAYYQDGEDALRLEKRLHGGHPLRTSVPYFRQATDFTCGPCCLRMAFAAFDVECGVDETAELRLWREATTIYLASGLGGCEPFGLAVAAKKRGLYAEIRVNTEEHFFLSSVRDAEKRRVMRLVQDDFRSEAKALSIPVFDRPLSAEELAGEAQRGTLSIVLISGYGMYRKKEPHWILVHGGDGRHLIVHDPWTEPEVAAGHDKGTDPDAIPETFADAAHLPIPLAAFERMARWGKQGVRAQILLRARPA